MAFAVWRHALAVDAKTGDETSSSCSIGGWVELVREGLLFSYAGHSGSPVVRDLSWKAKDADIKSTLPAVAVTHVDLDLNGRIEAIEFTAFMFIMKYAEKEQWSISRGRFREIFAATTSGSDTCDHVCQLFAIMGAPIFLMPENAPVSWANARNLMEADVATVTK